MILLPCRHTSACRQPAGPPSVAMLVLGAFVLAVFWGLVYGVWWALCTSRGTSSPPAACSNVTVGPVRHAATIVGMWSQLRAVLFRVSVALCGAHVTMKPLALLCSLSCGWIMSRATLCGRRRGSTCSSRTPSADAASCATSCACGSHWAWWHRQLAWWRRLWPFPSCLHAGVSYGALAAACHARCWC